MSGIDMDPDRAPIPFPTGADGHPLLGDGHPRRSREESPLPGFDYTQFVAAMQRLKEDNEKAESPVMAVMHVWKVLGIAGIVAILSGISTGYATFYGFKQELSSMARDIADNTRDIRMVVDDREKYRTKYLPMVETNTRQNETQQTQIDVLMSSMSSLRTTVETQSKSVAETHEDVAVLRNIIAMKFGLPGNPNASVR